MVYVVLAVIALGPAAILAHKLFGDLAAIFGVLAGALIVLIMLVWQGRTPQLEVDQ